ncbi:hypothetical protein ACWDA9_23945, partial [Streptomyces sp. NPDC001193]
MTEATARSGPADESAAETARAADRTADAAPLPVPRPARAGRAETVRFAATHAARVRPRGLPPAAPGGGGVRGP